MYCPSTYPTNGLETTVPASETVQCYMIYLERDHTTCFMIPKTGHCYIALIKDAFKDYVCAWIVNLNYCHKIGSRCLAPYFKHLTTIVLLKPIYETDEELSSANLSNENNSFHGLNREHTIATFETGFNESEYFS